VGSAGVKNWYPWAQSAVTERKECGGDRSGMDRRSGSKKLLGGRSAGGSVWLSLMGRVSKLVWMWRGNRPDPSSCTSNEQRCAGRSHVAGA
jgi:hypothetical protein